MAVFQHILPHFSQSILFIYFLICQEFKRILIKLPVLEVEVSGKYTVDEINKTNNFYWQNNKKRYGNYNISIKILLIVI